MNALILLLAPGIPWHVHDPVIQDMHSEANKWRTRYGVVSITLDEQCCILAQRHAEFMAQHNWFEHGQHDQIISRGYRDATGAIWSWVNSPPHLQCLISGRRRCGWGHAVSQDGVHYWAGVFR